ncbi:MAG TPA: hypothetical protein VIO14_06960 [Dehalococcoidia bacterium]
MSVNGTAAPAADVRELLPVAAVEDGVLLLRDGRAAAVIEARPVNFEFRSEQDQLAILGGLHRFFHALREPVTVLVRAVPADVEGYLERLRRPDLPPRLAELALDHEAFIRGLARAQTPLARSRYVIVTAGTGPALDQALASPLGALGSLGGALGALLGQLVGRLTGGPPAPPVPQAPAAGGVPPALRRALEQRCREVEQALQAQHIAARRLDGPALRALLASAWRPGSAVTETAAGPVQVGRPARR